MEPTNQVCVCANSSSFFHPEIFCSRFLHRHMCECTDLYLEASTRLVMLTWLSSISFCSVALVTELYRLTRCSKKKNRRVQWASAGDRKTASGQMMCMHFFLLINEVNRFKHSVSGKIKASTYTEVKCCYIKEHLLCWQTRTFHK